MHIPILVRRTVQVLLLAFVVLTVVQLIKGDALADALGYAGLWSVITAAVFGVGQSIQKRRGVRCALCEEEPQWEERDEGVAA